MRSRGWLAGLCLVVAAAAHGQTEPVIGLPCEGCEAVFDGKSAQIPSRARIAPPSEPGTPMVVVGRVLDPDGQPRPGVVVYAYQTNRDGIYPPPAVGRLRGWARSDASGHYAFDTIRPGSYPDDAVPAHIHLHVIEPGCATYYIDDIMFTDDPKLTGEQVRRIARNRGGNGIVTPHSSKGIWYAVRDIHLGREIPDYRRCRS
jgi:protocatechuate 3,4-dioxygenase beta subunit